jgi:hypothetical protein
MPFVLAELADWAIALLAALCAIAVTWMITQIGSVIGTIGVKLPIVGQVGINVGQAFVNAATSIENTCVDSGKKFFATLGDWIDGHAYLIKTLAASTVAAVTHLGDQIAHIYNTVIPEAEAAVSQFAYDYANTAAQDLRDVIEPEIGAAIKQAETYAGEAADNALTAAAQDVADLRTWTTQQLAGVASAAASDLAAAKKTINASISQTATDAANALSSDFGQAERDIATAKSDAETFAKTRADADLSTAEAYTDQASSTLGGLVKTAESNISDLAGTVAGDLTTAETYAETKAGDVLTAAETDIGGLKTDIQGQIGTLAGTVAGDLTTATDYAGGLVSGLAGTVAGDLTDAEKYAAGVADDAYDSAETDIGKLATSIPAMIALSLAPALARIAKLEDCSVGVCDDSPNNFSNLLNEALGIASFAEFGVFIEQAITNPKGTGQTFGAAAQGLYTDAHSLMSELLSL